MTNGYNALEKDEPVTKKPEKRGTALSLVAGLIVILVIISVLAYRSGIDIKQIRADVAAFSASLKERYAANGVDVNFKYASVEADGGFLHKTIKIMQPELSVADGNMSYKITAADVALMPEGSDFHSFSALVASPLIITEPTDGRIIRYKTTAPIAFDVTNNEADMREYLLKLQPKSVVELEHAGVVSSYDVAIAETSFIAGSFAPDAVGDYSVSVSLDDAIVAHRETKTTFSQLTYEFTASAEEGEETDASVETLVSDLIPNSLTPVSIDFSEKRTVDSQTQDIVFDVEKLIIAGDGFDLDVAGKISLKSSELLPLVDVKVKANGANNVVKALSDAHYFAPEIGHIIVSSLKRIAPEWNEKSLTPLEFSIHRTATEPFMIGNVKADELVAIALKEWYVSSEEKGKEGTVIMPTEMPTEPALGGEVAPAPTDENSNILDDATKVVTESKDGVISAVDNAKDTSTDAFDAVEETVDDVKDATIKATKDVNDETKDAVDAVKSKADDVMKSDALDVTKDAVDGAKDAVKENTQKVTE